jgi:tetratricopeptide (TPR) repeat protein
MAETYDVFLSHGTPDKPWVETLAKELDALGLRVFLDAYEIEAGDTFPVTLSNALRDSRFLVLILSPHSTRPWVELEWASFMAKHGPLGRILPVMLENTEVPTILEPVQRIDGTHRDAARVAGELATVVGLPTDLRNADARGLVIGQDLVFVLGRDGDELTITNPEGKARRVTLPWKVDNRFGLALHFYDRLTHEAVTTDRDRAELFERATTLGSGLFELLFEDEDRALLDRAMMPGRPRPLITLRSDDAMLLSLPWELLHLDGSFLLRDARVDVARSTLGEVGPRALLPEPEGFLKLVVNVSAPEGSGLEYEAESYRITKALSDRCPVVPTELGTLEDLVETVQTEKPTAVHFSGHGTPGALVFEDDEGRRQEVLIANMLRRLRERVSGGLPPLFYLASCHGNDPGEPATAALEKGEEGAESSAAVLHREGVPQVVGYYGPIVDELSTRAEVAFYRALAEGETTRYAIRQARAALAEPFAEPNTRHRPGEVVEESRGGLTAALEAEDHSHPFAWAQLVFYHRGPDRALSKPAVAGVWRRAEAPRRTFKGAGNRRVLSTGFIGRRNELHRVRRWLRRSERVFVFQGLGGLGKSTLALQVLPMLGSSEVVTLWCQETDEHPDRAEALIGQLLEFCRRRFGLEWEPVVPQVDRLAGDDPARRFELFLDALRQKTEGRLVVYLDNLESLLVLVGPADADAHDETAFGEWSSSSVAAIWRRLAVAARDSEDLYVVASCRYRNQDFTGALLPVSPLPADALFRLMGWFPALRQLSIANRVRLVERLAGHPRAVEFANDLLTGVEAAQEGGESPTWKVSEDRSARTADVEREWKQLMEPILPVVEGKVWDDLLLAQIWEHVLDEQARRMLYRMTLLRRPSEWELMALLGEAEDDRKASFSTAERLRATSLLEQLKVQVVNAEGRLRRVCRYTLHPAIYQFIRRSFREADIDRGATHRRLGGYFEREFHLLPLIETALEGSYHLFQAEEFDRASLLVGLASQILVQFGSTREAVAILEPFFVERVRSAIEPQRMEGLLGTAGLACQCLGEIEKAIGFFDEALIVAREVGNRSGEGMTLNNLGLAYAALARVEDAIAYYEKALVIAREIGRRDSEATALGNLGQVYADLGDVRQAIRFYKRELAILDGIGDQRLKGDALGLLGEAYAVLGDRKTAISYFKQRVEIARHIGDRRGEAAGLGNLGAAYANQGEAGKALSHYEKALVIDREIGDLRGEAKDLGNLGRAYTTLGEYEKATECYEKALLISRKIGDKRTEGRTLSSLGFAHADAGRTSKAITLLEQALEIGIAIQDPLIVAGVLPRLEGLRGS